MAETCERCRGKPVKHGAVALRLGEDSITGRATKLRKGPLDLCEDCYGDLIGRVTHSWEKFGDAK